MIACGIDVGSLTAEAVVFLDDDLLSYSIIRTGHDSAQTAMKALKKAIEPTNIRQEDIGFTVATGYGRLIVPFADKNVSEISCHARGAHHFFPAVRTILDMGGQDCKAIRCDDQGKVTTFLMNDKCAAGTGRAMEVMAALLDVRLEDIGPLSMAFEGIPTKISNTCVVFAKSEVLSLMRQGTAIQEILAGLCDAVADRVGGLIRRVGLEEDFAITGGIAKNVGVVHRLGQRLGVQPRICEEPQIVGAAGAALFARDFLRRSKA